LKKVLKTKAEIQGMLSAAKKVKTAIDAACAAAKSKGAKTSDDQFEAGEKILLEQSQKDPELLKALVHYVMVNLCVTEVRDPN
jgi:hypothetical protein